MSLADTLAEMARETRLLGSDLEAIVHKKKQGDTDTASRRSLEPVTRLRKNKEELIKVQNTDQDVQFVKDKLSDIFGG